MESDLICGKAVRALKTVKLPSCHDKDENVKQGNGCPDNLDLIEDSDSQVPAFGCYCHWVRYWARQFDFRPIDDYEAFEVTDIVENGRHCLHFLSMLSRKHDSVVKERDSLIAQVARLTEENQKLLANNSKLLTRIFDLTIKETTFAEETIKHEGVE
ncbi:hypothetical protein LWI28_028256 [Acer negundo]|uniref:Uncharacterized protein n=1 Tax=Acer negundo TaxID=4023 RepID=A0AAD5P500_ACENE|nr:hypothetical protein LWI28_028256 [Acer negundo]